MFCQLECDQNADPLRLSVSLQALAVSKQLEVLYKSANARPESA